MFLSWRRGTPGTSPPSRCRAEVLRGRPPHNAISTAVSSVWDVLTTPPRTYTMHERSREELKMQIHYCISCSCWRSSYWGWCKMSLWPLPSRKRLYVAKVIESRNKCIDNMLHFTLSHFALLHICSFTAAAINCTVFCAAIWGKKKVDIVTCYHAVAVGKTYLPVVEHEID